jgi:hypothetical protein
LAVPTSEAQSNPLKAVEREVVARHRLADLCAHLPIRRFECRLQHGLRGQPRGPVCSGHRTLRVAREAPRQLRRTIAFEVRRPGQCAQTSVADDRSGQCRAVRQRARELAVAIDDPHHVVVEIAGQQQRVGEFALARVGR